MDPKFKEQQLKEKVTYALALRYVNKYRDKNDIHPQTAIQQDQVMLSSLVEELLIISKNCDGCKAIYEHYDGIRKYWTS